MEFFADFDTNAWLFIGMLILVVQLQLVLFVSSGMSTSIEKHLREVRALLHSR